MKTSTTIKIKKADYIKLGSNKTSEGWQFGILCAEDELCLNLCDNKGKVKQIIIPKSYKYGNIYSFKLDGRLDGMSYSIGREKQADPYAGNYRYSDEEEDYFGQPREKLESILVDEEYDWQEDICPDIAINDMLVYKLHVRGFTKADKTVAYPGTFKALGDKAEYIKDMGFNTVMLMPAYDFHEVKPVVKDRYSVIYSPLNKVNYWGYAGGYYFAPKRAYAASDNALAEFRDMIKAYHRLGIEVIMEFFFPDNMSVQLILEILRFWHISNHVDGFRLICSSGSLYAVQTDMALMNCKIFAKDFGGEIYNTGATEANSNNRLIWYDSGFMEAGRHLLRGDEDSIRPFTEKMTGRRYSYPVVDFMADHDGMTLMDMVSYERRHNEANCENNRDGSSHNISQNCGVEGVTEDEAVIAKRLRLIKSAYIMTMMSASVPLIMAGDEFAQTQLGNNNPYCQDNEISYIDWSLMENNIELRDFLKKLIKIRKEHGCIHPENAFFHNDHLNKGMPDVSFHSERAWYPIMEEYSRHIGILYCGAYAEEKENVYILFNMHNEKHEFAIPGSQETVWRLAATTDEAAVEYKKGSKKISLLPGNAAIFIS